MKPPILLSIALVLAACPPGVQAKPHKSGEAGAQLPPKWSSMIQPLGPDTSLQSGLISSELSGRDLNFLTSSLDAGRMQVALCKSAKEKGESDQVKSVGDALEGMQAQENTYLTRLAAKKGLVIDATTIQPTQRKVSAEVASLTGAKFDKEVMDYIIATAQQSVTSYESGLQSSDAEIKSLAEQLLPVAKDKLRLATSIIGKSQQTNVKPAFRASGPAAPSAVAATPAPAKAEPAALKPPPPRPDGPKPVPVLTPIVPARAPAAATPAPATPAKAK